VLLHVLRIFWEHIDRSFVREMQTKLLFDSSLQGNRKLIFEVKSSPNIVDIILLWDQIFVTFIVFIFELIFWLVCSSNWKRRWSNSLKNLRNIRCKSDASQFVKDTFDCFIFLSFAVLSILPICENENGVCVTCILWIQTSKLNEKIEAKIQQMFEWFIIELIRNKTEGIIKYFKTFLSCEEEIDKLKQLQLKKKLELN